VLHFSHLLRELLRKGLIKPLKNVNIKVSYHDPCELARHAGVYDAPREVIKSLPGIKLQEAKYSREKSRCCGGGGGVLLNYPELAVAGAYNRLSKDILPLGVEGLVTACPACYLNFEYAIERYELPLKLYDISELLLLTLGDEREEG